VAALGEELIDRAQAGHASLQAIEQRIAGQKLNAVRSFKGDELGALFPVVSGANLCREHHATSLAKVKHICVTHSIIFPQKHLMWHNNGRGLSYSTPAAKIVAPEPTFC
jgi:hypothetical protein